MATFPPISFKNYSQNFKKLQLSTTTILALLALALLALLAIQWEWKENFQSLFRFPKWTYYRPRV